MQAQQGTQPLGPQNCVWGERVSAAPRPEALPAELTPRAGHPPPGARLPCTRTSPRPGPVAPAALGHRFSTHALWTSPQRGMRTPQTLHLNAQHSVCVPYGKEVGGRCPARPPQGRGPPGAQARGSAICLFGGCLSLMAQGPGAHCRLQTPLVQAVPHGGGAPGGLLKAGTGPAEQQEHPDLRGCGVRVLCPDLTRAGEAVGRV